MNVALADTTPASMWHPLRHRHFRRFLLAAAVSNAGSWMQTVAVPFAIYEITNSKSWLGFSSFLGLILGMVANTPGGILADRYSRRVVLGATQVLQMISALLLWTLWAWGKPSILTILPLVVLGSAGSGLSMPGWQSFIPSLVPADEMMAAVRLNSTQFAMARTVGPILGAFTLRFFGPAVCFMANALSFLVIIGVLIFVPDVTEKTDEGRGKLRLQDAINELVDGWHHLRAQQGLRYAPIAVFVNAAFGFGLTALAPAMARDQFHFKSSDNGLLLSAFGIGGLGAVVGIGMYAKHWRNSAQVQSAFVAWVLAGGILALTVNFWVGCVAWIVAGYANSVGGTALNTAVQTQVSDEFRGRVMAMYMQMFFLGSGLGALFLGFAADLVSLQFAELCSCVVFLGFHLWSRKRYANLRVLDSDFQTEPVR
jgi:MFS family permease